MRLRLEQREKSSPWLNLTLPLAAIAATLVLCGGLIALAGANVIEAYTVLFASALDSKFNIVETIVKAAPLVLTGLAVAVAFRAKFWNIGAEGQFLLGAMAAVFVGTQENLPAWSYVPLMILCGFLADAAVPLVQFMPGAPIRPSYPPTPSDGNGLLGGGPLGGQIGVPSYFMPEQNYSPMWHIGFAHWHEPAMEIVKGLSQVKKLREDGKLEIVEWPGAANVGNDNYDFDALNAPHVVNCPTPITIDTAIHRVRKLLGEGVSTVE